MGLTVKDILKLSLLKEANVIAGKDGLNRLVKSVSFMEAPDSMNWIMEYDFLITNAYLIKNNQKIKCNLIPKLAKMNAAGLGVKLNRFLDYIPEH